MSSLWLCLDCKFRNLESFTRCKSCFAASPRKKLASYTLQEQNETLQFGIFLDDKFNITKTLKKRDYPRNYFKYCNYWKNKSRLFITGSNIIHLNNISLKQINNNILIRQLSDFSNKYFYSELIDNENFKSLLNITMKSQTNIRDPYFCNGRYYKQQIYDKTNNKHILGYWGSRFYISVDYNARILYLLHYRARDEEWISNSNNDEYYAYQINNLKFASIKYLIPWVGKDISQIIAWLALS